MDTDRNLLFGVLALQVDLITPNQFAQASARWAADKGRGLGDILVEQGWLAAADRQDVEKLLQRKLAKHKGDVKASLIEVTSDQVRQSLIGVADPDIQQSMAGLTPPPLGHVLIATTAHTPQSQERYTLTRLHASGGLGRIWLARDDNLGRDVALKDLRPERANNPATWARFLREARVTGQLEHPNIVPVYEVGHSANDQPFYTMRFVRGRTLSEAARDYHKPERKGQPGVMSLRELLNAFVGVCNAIAYAHSRGVIHRDLKPQNVVLGDFGEVLVLDWGLAKVTGETGAEDLSVPPALTGDSVGSTDHTIAGQVLGTPAYMAPEQAEGRLDLLDARADVYGLGAVLYEILTGKPPFTGGDTATVLRRVTHEPPAHPRSIVAETPAALAAVCMKALEKKSSDRYASAKDLAFDIQHYLADEPVLAYREPLSVRLGRFARRNRTLVTASAVALVVTTVIFAVAALILDKKNGDLAVALSNEQEARKAEKEANDKLGVALQQEQQARQAEREAQDVALSQNDLALRAMNQLTFHLQMELEETPGGRHLRKELLEYAIPKLKLLYQSPTTNPRFLRSHCAAHIQLADLHWLLLERDEAEKEYKNALGYAELAYRNYPESEMSQRNMAACKGIIGEMELNYRNRPEPGLKYVHDSLSLWQELARKLEQNPEGDPALPVLERFNLMETEENIADTYDRLGSVSLRHDIDLAKAEEWFNKAWEIRKRHMEKHPSRQHRMALATSFHRLAQVAMQRGELTKVISSHTDHVKLIEEVYAGRSWSMRSRRELAEAQGLLGDDLMLARRNDEGHKLYGSSLKLYEQLLAAELDDPTYRSTLAHAHYRRGTSFLRLGDPKSARLEFEECLRLRTLVYDGVKDDLQRLHMQSTYMYALARCGKHVEAAEMAANVRKKLGTISAHVAFAGGCYALCRVAVGEGKPEAALTPEEKQLRKRYLDLALECLEEARKNSFKEILYLEKDSDFECLRGVPEFEAWLDSFRESLKKK
jgi:tRNA A-37 threonylcarbamoyl transferase component Bud32